MNLHMNVLIFKSLVVNYVGGILHLINLKSLAQVVNENISQKKPSKNTSPPAGRFREPSISADTI
jgi:hypothetical protein